MQAQIDEICIVKLARFFDSRKKLCSSKRISFLNEYWHVFNLCICANMCVSRLVCCPKLYEYYTHTPSLSSLSPHTHARTRTRTRTHTDCQILIRFGVEQQQQKYRRIHRFRCILSLNDSHLPPINNTNICQKHVSELHLYANLHTLMIFILFFARIASLNLVIARLL